MKTKKISIFLFQFLCILVLFNIDVYTQNKDANSVDIARSQYICARVMTDNLSDKLTLNQNQKKEIVNILLDFQENLFALSPTKYNYSDDNNDSEQEDKNMTGSQQKNNYQRLRDTENEANEKIESILSGKQLSTYYRVKGEWWTHLKRITLHNK